MAPELPFDDQEASTNLPLATQIFRFVVTGVGSGILDFGLTAILQYALGMPAGFAKAIGFVCGTTTAYIFNRRWTFRAEPSMARFVAVAVLYCVTFVVNVGVYTYLSHLWPETVLYSLLAYVIAQGLATIINFIVQRTVIFNIK
ncbi:GtrA family protein [Gordonia sp. DT219]|uniref:GtrA family protein n=1 Tax=Gordonia sp. DT219 TaxID=3416658 RepID=UPI003CF602FC